MKWNYVTWVELALKYVHEIDLMSYKNTPIFLHALVLLDMEITQSNDIVALPQISSRKQMNIYIDEQILCTGAVDLWNVQKFMIWTLTTTELKVISSKDFGV